MEKANAIIREKCEGKGACYFRLSGSPPFFNLDIWQTK